MTVAFKASANAWTSRYSFDTSCFAFVDNAMVSFNSENTDGTALVYKHSVESNPNEFYGVASDSQFTVTFNDNPSKNKVYKAVSLEGANLKDAKASFVANLSPQFNQSREGQVFEGFVEKGGVFYGGLTKSNLTDPTNNLKAVGGIRKVKRLSGEGVSNSINNGTFPFQGYGGGGITDTVFIQVTPYPHYKQLGSASGNGVVSKYVFGFLTDQGVDLRTPKVDIDTATDPFYFLDTNSDQVLGRMQTFAEQPDSIVNTDGISKYKNHVVVKLTNQVVGDAPVGTDIENIKVTAFVNAVNNYIANGGEIMLFKVTDDRIDGADPRGQYGDFTVSVPPVDFEIFAVNMEYSPTELDHSKG